MRSRGVCPLRRCRRKVALASLVLDAHAMTAKRLVPDIDRRTFSRVRVWRDDLAKVINLVEQVNPKYTITLMTSSYRVSTIWTSLNVHVCRASQSRRTRRRKSSSH
jgi:hypothetical protein